MKENKKSLAKIKFRNQYLPFNRSPLLFSNTLNFCWQIKCLKININIIRQKNCNEWCHNFINALRVSAGWVSNAPNK